MKYLKSYESFDSPKIDSFSQQTPNGLGGSFDLNNDTYVKDLPINNDNDFKRIMRDVGKKYKKKTKYLKSKFIAEKE